MHVSVQILYFCQQRKTVLSYVPLRNNFSLSMASLLVYAISNLDNAFTRRRFVVMLVESKLIGVPKMLHCEITFIISEKTTQNEFYNIQPEMD